jgi:hypothetical protein
MATEVRRRAVASFYPHLYEAALALLIEAREKAGLSHADS